LLISETWTDYPTMTMDKLTENSTQQTTFHLPPHPTLKQYYADEKERRSHLNQVFDASARHYDDINWAMSLGTGQRYRRQALQRAGLDVGMSVLDVGCGTGLMTQPAAEMVGPRGLVVGVDPSIGMLQEATRWNRVDWAIQGTAECLPVPDNSFDLLSMSYMLRHVSDLLVAFRECMRVLKPGGVLVILEITPPRLWLAYHLLKMYLKFVVPTITRVGTVSRNDQRLMKYYWDTIDQCVPPETIREAMHRAGFGQIDRHVDLGIFSQYTARKG
jgi:demethylmenaquinone methyltransferase/2-methoxy-6-polyprenyl-1,4-benzoquinol methylase